MKGGFSLCASTVLPACVLQLQADYEDKLFRLKERERRAKDTERRWLEREATLEKELAQGSSSSFLSLSFRVASFPFHSPSLSLRSAAPAREDGFQERKAHRTEARALGHA